MPVFEQDEAAEDDSFDARERDGGLLASILLPPTQLIDRTYDRVEKNKNTSWGWQNVRYGTLITVKLSELRN